MAAMDIRQTFQDHLHSLLGRTRRRILVLGLLRVLAVAGPMTVLAVWSLGTGPEPGPVLAGGLVFSLLAAWVALVWTQVVLPLWRLRRPVDLVDRVEKFGDFANVLVAGEEALRQPERWDANTSVRRELLDRVFRQGLRILSFLSPERVFPHRYLRAGLVGLGLLGAGVLFIGLAQPTVGRQGMARLLRPIPPAAVPQVAGIYPWDTPDHVVAGEEVRLSVRDFGGGTDLAVCEIRVGQGLWQPLEARSETVPRDQAFLPPPFKLWMSQVDNVREDFSWRFRRGSRVSPEQRVTVRHHPLLTNLGVTIQPPEYTGLDEQSLDRLPTWLEVPTGAVLVLQGTANHPLSEADLVISGQEPQALAISGSRVEGALRVEDSLTFQLALQDSFGLTNLSPLVYELRAIPDEKPLVQLVRPGDDGLLPLDGILPLGLDATDDYGLTRLELQLRVVDGPEASEDDTGWTQGTHRVWQGTGPAGGSFSTAWGTVRLDARMAENDGAPLRVGMQVDADIADLDLVPGDVLELRLGAVDNHRPGSGQISYSRALRLILPSAADVLANQAEANEQRRDELEEARRRGLELGQDLDRLNRELMKNPLPDWARRQEMEEAIARQQRLQEELSRLAAELTRDLDRLASGQMTSERMLEKAEEVSSLLNQDPDQSLQDLLERMKQSGEEAAAEEMARAIREVGQDQKDMARRLDAALAMLNRMEREQEMEGLTALLEQMIRKQQELADLSRELADQKEQEAGEGQDQEAAGDPDAESGEQQEGDPQQGDQQEGEQQDGDQQQGEQQQGEQQSSEQQEGSPEESPTAEELARRQEALAEELEELEERLEKALAELQEQQQESGQQSPDSEKMEQALQDALEQLERQKEKGGMKKASEQLSQMDPGQAAKLQQESLRDLGALYHVILETQQAMQSAMQQNQVSSLRGLAADMLALSTRQEEISLAIPAQLRDVRSLGLTRSQHRLQRSATGVRDRLSLLLEEAPARIMRLLAKLDELIEQMGHTVQSMEDNRGPVARRDALASLASANRIVIGLLTEAQITSQSSSPGSSGQQQSMAQQLQQMAQEQAKLNGMTDQLRQMLANRGMSQEARSQMKRLGEAQGNLAGQLQELEEKERENAEGERLLGDLGELGRQMESISGEMDDGLVSEETLVRQERILSRLLDARNSVRRRDYTSRRESRTAGQLYTDMQGPLDGEDPAAAERSFRLRYQALEKAPLEYRDLVRRYFAALDSLRVLDGSDLWPEKTDQRKELP